MNEDANQPGTPRQGAIVWRVLFEAGLVAIFGAALAFAANAISPRRLSLTRNYFPGATSNTVAAPLRAPVAQQRSSSNQVSAARLLAERIKAEGFRLLNREQTVRLFRDPRFDQERVVFVDARDEDHYREGHIPGAYELDPYHPELHLATVLPACQAAEEIVVYCNGGDCEDSQFGAILLRDAGIAAEKLFIYGGGISDWATNGLPVEIGERRSGALRISGR